MEAIHWKNIRLVPIVHGRMEFAVEVGRQFRDYNPDHVAVEYPGTLKEKIILGIKRLPLLSVVHYREKDGAFTYLVLEPADGLVEAVRLALEKGIPAHFVDRDTERYPLDTSPMPDSYAVKRIGFASYYQAYDSVHRHDMSSPADILREKTMARHLRELHQNAKRVLFVGGMAHIRGILEQLDQPQAQVIGKTKREGVGLAHLHEDSSREILAEMPYCISIYENARKDDQTENLDRLQINADMIDAAKKTPLEKQQGRDHPFTAQDPE